MERIECKFAADDLDAKTGAFSGYGAIFGNIDTHGDVIVPGAFRDSLSAWGQRGSLPSMKLMHGTTANPFSGDDTPIGVWKVMREDSKGLYVEGKLSGLDTDRGRFNYALLQDGALNALSIGFKTVKAARGNMPQIKRQLEVINLREVSLLPEGSNPEARVTDIKAYIQSLETEDWRDIEAVLRTKDLSRSDAVKAVAGFKEWLRRDAGESGQSPRDEDEAEVVASIRRNLDRLTTR